MRVPMVTWWCPRCECTKAWRRRASRDKKATCKRCGYEGTKEEFRRPPDGVLLIKAEKPGRRGPRFKFVDPASVRRKAAVMAEEDRRVFRSVACPVGLLAVWDEREGAERPWVWKVWVGSEAQFDEFMGRQTMERDPHYIAIVDGQPYDLLTVTELWEPLDSEMLVVWNERAGVR